MALISLSQKKINLVDLIVLASYYFFSLFLLLSLLGFFRKEFIALGLAVGFLLFLMFFRQKIEFKKRYLYFFILVPILFTGILLIRGSFGGDGIDYWLPWAREIVWQERMPDFLSKTAIWLTSRMPLMPLFYAGAFSFFGFHDWVIAFLPFFFASATAFLIYLWLLEKGVGKKYIIFGVLLLLTSPLFLDWSGEIKQESFILFFFAAFFYYWEKSREGGNRFYLLLAFLSAILASATKETGFILFLFLGWFLIKNKLFKKQYFCYLCFLTFPLLLWLLRNYIIYDNPFFPFLKEIFRGRYYGVFSASNQIFQTFHPPFWTLSRIIEIPVSLFLSFFPLIILSFYGFFKQRKVQYILLFFISLLIILTIADKGSYIRFLMPFLSIFIVYAVAALEKIKSKIFLSFLFFLNLWGLFSTKLSLSRSQFFSPVEEVLSGFGGISQLVYDYRLIIALALGIFFFFFISSRQPQAKYLILLLAGFYLVKTRSFNLGSWLNIWLPILSLVFVILIWRLAMKLREERLFKAILGYLIILLFLNSWGLPVAYFLAQGQIVFPNVVEAYEDQPETAAVIEKREGKNRDFYLFASSDSYFTWYHDFKVVIPQQPNFHIVTNLEFKDSLNSQEIHSLFKRSGIKYLVNNHSNRLPLEPFFNKIKSRPDLFETLFQKERLYLWLVK